MTSRRDASRREFLTGGAVQKEIRHLGDEFVDGLNNGSERRTPPVAGETVRLETKAMGCPWVVIMNPGDPRQIMAATDAFDVVRDAEQLLTIYRDDSDTARLNKSAAEDWTEGPKELIDFLLTCRELYDTTNRAFDPAAGTLIQQWKSAREQGRIPTDYDLLKALENSGLQHVELDVEQQKVKFDRQGLKLDFASIGKGYGIDKAAEHLKHEEVSDFLVHGGQSSLIAAGTHFGHDGWPVGLKNPLFTEKRYATLLLKDVAMSTSGSNIQYFRYQGRRYGHLLDPRTGQPAGGMLSVTVFAPTATAADALSTAFYVMGLDNALKYCDDHPEIGAILLPAAKQGRVLEPVVKNIPVERLFFEQDVSPKLA